MMNKLTIYAHRTHPDAVIPSVAYDNSSACFDITCIEDTTIPPHSSKVVPNGLNLAIDQKDDYWMQIQLRSSKGFKEELLPHAGVIDCVPAGTQILTPSGLKKVEDLFNNFDKNNKFIISYNESLMDIETDEIEDIWIEKNKDLMSIETEEGDFIEIPFSKQVYTKRGWVEIQNLKKDDLILKIIQ